MSLEWFDRVSAELQDSLESICEEYDQVGHLSIDKAAKHPRLEFFVEMEEEREYFCSLFFDPHNNEFYIESFDLDLDLTSRTILEDIEDIIDVVHESFHDFLDDEDEDEYDYEFEDEDAIEYDLADDEDDIETYDVEWETPEVTAYIDEDEDIEISYKFGIIQETGDGILQRINRIKTIDNELIKDEFNFIFSKDEASTIIAMIASHMESLNSLE